MDKKIKSELHHWWPRSLSKFWASADGRVSCLRSQGELIRSLPKSFGAIRNDNNITLASRPTVWDESFERAFAKADNHFPDLVSRLQRLSCEIPATDGAFEKRIQPLILNAEMHGMLSESLASLVARSPSLRNRVRLTTEYYRTRMGFPDPSASSALIGLNVRDAQRVLRDAFVSRGKYAVLFSGSSEFIFGDGFFHNISSVSNRPSSPRCLIPITPDIAIFYTSPLSYRGYPKAFTLNLTPSEVTFVNDTIQIYSKRFLFFRDRCPDIHPKFRDCEHYRYEYDDHPWIDHLSYSIAETYFGSDAEFYPQDAP